MLFKIENPIKIEGVIKNNSYITIKNLIMFFFTRKINIVMKL